MPRSSEFVNKMLSNPKRKRNRFSVANRRTPDIHVRAAHRLGPTLAPLRAKASSAISQRDEGASIRDWVTVLAASEVDMTHCVGHYCLLERDSCAQAISGLGAIELNRGVRHLGAR
jgi:hypothetical protein